MPTPKTSSTTITQSNTVGSYGGNMVGITSSWTRNTYYTYYKITKVGGVNNPYACMQLPGIWIPRDSINLLETNGLHIDFINDLIKERIKITCCISTRGI